MAYGIFARVLQNEQRDSESEPGQNPAPGAIRALLS
jgi:hypothetical protein